LRYWYGTADLTDGVRGLFNGLVTGIVSGPAAGVLLTGSAGDSPIEVLTLS